jgi:hypothetical protein
MCEQVTGDEPLLTEDETPAEPVVTDDVPTDTPADGHDPTES